MKWYFAINETGTLTGAGHLARLAVTSARRFTTLDPHLLYYGRRNGFTAWMEEQGVKVIDAKPGFEPAMAQAIDAGWYPRTLAGHWLRTEICNIETSAAFVLYTDVDVMFMKSIDLSTVEPRYFACAPESNEDGWDHFNSGVMLMNLPALRDDYPRLRAEIERRFQDPANGPFNDQPVYNAMYRGMWDRLDPRYNWKPYWNENPDAAILHFHGPKFDAIRLIIDGKWDWHRAYERRAGIMVIGNLERYLSFFHMMHALTEPGDALRTMIEGVLRDAPAALPGLRRLRDRLLPSDGKAETDAAVSVSSVGADGWVSQGRDAWMRTDELAIVFRDRSDDRAEWLGGLRGRAARLIDPSFLTDANGRIRHFSTAADARAACDAALSSGQDARRETA